MKYINLVFLVLLLIGCKSNDYFIYDLSGTAFNVNDIYQESNELVFVVVDFVSCHECFINLSKFLSDSSYFFERSKVVLIGLTSINSVAEKKFYLRTFEKYLEKYAQNAFFVARDNNFVKSIIPCNLGSPSLLIWQRKENKFTYLPYKELFDSNNSKITEYAIRKLKMILLKS
jgi:hypothetical protein